MKKKKFVGITAMLPFALCNLTTLPVYAEVTDYQEAETGVEETSAECQVIYKTTYDFSEEIPKYPELEVSASGYEGVYDGKSHGITVDCKTDGAEILYSTDGEKFTKKKPVYTDVGTYVTYYKVEKDGHATTTGWAAVKITEAKIDYAVNDYNGPYDGKPHSIDLSVRTDGCRVMYSEDGINFTSKKPEYKDAGTYTVYYKITKDNYETVTGNGRIIIKEKDNGIKISDTSGTVKVDDTISFTVDTDGEPFDIEVSDPSIAKVTVKNGLVTVTGLKKGTVTITITCNGEIAVYRVTVIDKNDIRLSDTSGTVKVDDTISFTVDTDGEPFDIEISDPSIAKVTVKDGLVTVTGLKKGTATITIICNGKSAAYRITVTDKDISNSGNINPSKNTGNNPDKLSDVQTGDENNILLYGAMLIASVSGLTTLKRSLQIKSQA